MITVGRISLGRSQSRDPSLKLQLRFALTISHRYGKAIEMGALSGVRALVMPASDEWEIWSWQITWLLLAQSASAELLSGEVRSRNNSHSEQLRAFDFPFRCWQRSAVHRTARRAIVIGSRASTQNVEMQQPGAGTESLSRVREASLAPAPTSMSDSHRHQTMAKKQEVGFEESL